MQNNILQEGLKFIVFEAFWESWFWTECQCFSLRDMPLCSRHAGLKGGVVHSQLPL